MRIGLLFHKDPLAPAVGVDLVRLRALGHALADLGAEVSVVAPVAREGSRLGRVPALPLEALEDRGRFDLVKACYHFSLELLGRYDGPLVCRLVRVADERAPERDQAARPRLLACQAQARERAWGMVFNNRVNARRWRDRYGRPWRAALIPTGCPAEIPPPGPSPYPPGPPPALFLGSLASPHMAEMLAGAARALKGMAQVHFVGRDKTALYGGRGIVAPPGVTVHGEMEESRVWDFARHARLGLAFAAGPDLFDNDLSKLVTYLRAGLPVLMEQGLANAWLVERAGLGAAFRHGDARDLGRAAEALLRADFSARAPLAMARMATVHSWRRRADALLRFCTRVLEAGRPGSLGGPGAEQGAEQGAGAGPGLGGR